MSIDFLISNLLLGVGLAMDAFSVSVANGLHAPDMPRSKQFRIAGVFAFFQYLMPMLGWLGVRVIESAFSAFNRAVPWIALVLLCYIGGKMLLEGIKNDAAPEENVPLTWSALILQGIATSIDALSAGFALAEYTFLQALLSGLIIAVVTLVLCLLGVRIGQKAGQYLTRWASVLGGLILIGIGIKIFVEGVF